MIYTFDKYILESLKFNTGTLADAGNEKHYRERHGQRLSELEVGKLIDEKGKAVKVEDSTNKDITKFFRNAYSAIADPNGSLFDKTDIDIGRFGVVYLGEPSVILEDGTTVTPEFIVPLGKDNKKIRGFHFYIQTSGETPLTILLQDVKPNSKENIDKLKRIAFNHIATKRQADLARRERMAKQKLNHETGIEVKSNPNNVVLDFTSELNIDDQLGNILERARKEEVERITLANYTPPEPMPIVPRQMNVIPEKMWLLDYVESKKLWTAHRINGAKLIKGDPNHIELQLSKKVLYYFESKPASTYKSGMNTIDPGQKINIAKQLPGGTWVKLSCTVQSLSIDPRNGNTNPFIMADEKGWTQTALNPEEHELDQIFSVKESVLNFNDWIYNRV